MKSSTREWSLGLLLAAMGTAGCALAPRTVPVDPAASFAAHRDCRGIVIDRMEHGQSGLLVSRGSTFAAGAPHVAIRTDDTTIATLWLNGPVTIVRRTEEAAGPPVGQVDAVWDARAIRLTLRPAVGEAYETGAFRRVGSEKTPALLGEAADTLLDVRGVYRAEVRDAEGTPVGWLRVRVSPYQAASRVYDGVLPEAIPGSLAAAAVARLDAELDWIEAHATDPYLGN